MRVLVISTVAVVAIVSFGHRAHAQQIKKSTLTGMVVTMAVNVPANGSATVYTTPTKGAFILTQVCVDDDVDVAGATVGPFVNDKGGCETYSPGIACPSGEAITCVNNDADPGECLITGVLSRK